MKSALIFPPLIKLKVGDFKELYEMIPSIKMKFAESSDILGFNLAESFFSDNPEIVNKGVVARPSIVTISAALFELLDSDIKENDFFLGPSLGMVSAIHCSGCIDFEETIKMTHTFCKLEEDPALKGYGVSFFYNIQNELVLSFIDEIKSPTNYLEVCVYVSENQLIINGDFTSLNLLAKKVNDAGGLGVQIPYGPPGHCSLLSDIGKRFEMEFLNHMQIKDPLVPLIGNSKAQILRTKEEVKQELVDQYTNPVLWVQSLYALQNLGVEDLNFLGPGNFIYKSLSFTKVNFNARPFLTIDELLKA